MVKCDIKKKENLAFGVILKQSCLDGNLLVFQAK